MGNEKTRASEARVSSCPIKKGQTARSTGGFQAVHCSFDRWKDLAADRETGLSREGFSLSTVTGCNGDRLCGIFGIPRGDFGPRRSLSHMREEQLSKVNGRG
jgi:hypothetical protein